MLTVLLVSAAGTPLTAQQDAARDTPLEALEAYRNELASLASEGSWWRASNASYTEQDGNAADAYGTRFWLDPGGLSAGGCLWSIREGEPVAVHWTFHQGWDFSRGQPFYYQAHTSGTGTGMGWETHRAPGVSVMSRRFVGRTGAASGSCTAASGPAPTRT